MNEFFTWPTLATLAGVSLATAIATQFAKNAADTVCLKLFKRTAPTQYLSYIIALVILVCANLATGVQGWSNYAILVINAVVVSLGANGGYSAVVRKTTTKK